MGLTFSNTEIATLPKLISLFSSSKPFERNTPAQNSPKQLAVIIQRGEDQGGLLTRSNQNSRLQTQHKKTTSTRCRLSKRLIPIRRSLLGEQICCLANKHVKRQTCRLHTIHTELASSRAYIYPALFRCDGVGFFLSLRSRRKTTQQLFI